MNPSWKHVALLLGTLVLFFATTEAARIIKGRALSSLSMHKISLCHGIDHPKLCIPIAKKSSKGGVQRLAQLTIKETMAMAHVASKLAVHLQDKLKHSKKSRVYKLLDVCRENFESMSDDLKATMASLKGKSDDPIRNSLSALSTYIETCTDAYDETPHVKSPFGTTIRPMEQLVDNLFWMADKLKV